MLKGTQEAKTEPQIALGSHDSLPGENTIVRNVSHVRTMLCSEQIFHLH